MRRGSVVKLFVCAVIVIVVSGQLAIHWRTNSIHIQRPPNDQSNGGGSDDGGAEDTQLELVNPPSIGKPHKDIVVEQHSQKPQVKHPQFPEGAPLPEPYVLDLNHTERQRRVVSAFKHAWENYRKYAWGHDELRPISLTWVDWGSHLGGKTGIGLTAIESLDTMWLMGLHDEFHDVIRWLQTNHTFDLNVEVGIFETTIRVLGGLLSAYELSGVPVLLTKAHDLGIRLMHTFAGGRIIPYASVNLRTLEASNPRWLSTSQSLSEVTTIQIEFKTLSHFTGDPQFDKAAKRVMSVILNYIDKIPGNLYPPFISLKTGEPQPDAITLGARGDSFYEYLVKQWVMTNRTDEVLQTAWEKVRSGIVKHLLVQINATHAFPAEAAYDGAGFHKILKMDHLVCFTPGMFLLGSHGTGQLQEADVKIAADIARVCAGMYKIFPTGLAPEIVRFHGTQSEMYASPGACHYILRPEALEAQFYMYRYTGDEAWAENGWQMFEAMERNLKVPHGWAGIKDVTRHGPRLEHIDKMESFFLAETLKYAFLISGDAWVIPLDEWVFNTEAHPLRILPPSTVPSP